MSKAFFKKEADLCDLFIKSIPETWQAYPETGGFDILLVRKEDGFQIGIEAKLKLNAKVVTQAAEPTNPRYVARPNPDCRTVLMPEGCSYDLAEICHLLNITVIRMCSPEDTLNFRHRPFWPRLPEIDDDYYYNDWYELAPSKRIELPNWIPDVGAGKPAPVKLTHWKISAIKIALTIEKRGYVTRQDFAFFKISMSRWTQDGWIVKKSDGGWAAGNYMPDFKAQHPLNYEQILADYEIWKSPAPTDVQAVMI